MTSTSRARGEDPTGRTLLDGVRVFDGQRLSEPCGVVIDGSVIGDDPTGARKIDADGAVLLPGLIDAHIHLHGRDTLESLCSWGVTTALDMGSWPPALVSSLRSVAGLTDIRSPGLLAIGPGGPHANLPGMPAEAIVLDPPGAERFVADRATEAADYIKIVLEAPGDGGPDPATALALVNAAHRHGKRVVAHAASHGAYALALDVGADIVTHVPLGEPLAEAVAARMAGDNRVAVPTLTMMEALAALGGNADSFDGALGGVAALSRAGVPILAGTDAADQPGVPRLIAGESLHHELELLVGAGLSAVEALRAATVLPARYFGLTDRGRIEPGWRADLVLINGDPLADISTTANISRVWCAGVEYGLA